MTLVDELLQTGIRRVGSPKKGFRWIGATKKDLDRLHELKIPPAWTEVAVSRRPRAKVQAVGKDKAGRWQYRYSDEAVLERERKKYNRLVAFAHALPKLRKAIDRGLALPGLPRDKVMACILRILSTCFMRPGSEVYAKENGSFGIATLQTGHASVHGDLVRFDYPGKSGKRQVRELRDRRVARTVRELATPIALAKKLARRSREKAAWSKMSRRVRSPRMRRLIEAFRCTSGRPQARCVPSVHHSTRSGTSWPAATTGPFLRARSCSTRQADPWDPMHRLERCARCSTRSAGSCVACASPPRSGSARSASRERSSSCCSSWPRGRGCP